MIIPATSRTPEVAFSEQQCSIKGECYPEDISEFSIPIMENIKQTRHAIPYREVVEFRLELSSRF